MPSEICPFRLNVDSGVLLLCLLEVSLSLDLFSATMHPLHRPAPIAPGDPQRVAILRSLGLLDSPSEECYDRITQSACDIFNVPIALISLVDRDRQVSVQAPDARAHALSLHTRRACEVQTAALQSVLRAQRLTCPRARNCTSGSSPGWAWTCARRRETLPFARTRSIRSRLRRL